MGVRYHVKPAYDIVILFDDRFVYGSGEVFVIADAEDALLTNAMKSWLVFEASGLPDPPARNDGGFGGGSGLPDGGTSGQTLIKNSVTDGDAVWRDTHYPPVGGANGQALTKTGSGDYAWAWADVSGGGSPGESAYQIAVDNGFSGTEGEWVDSLQGFGFDFREEWDADTDYFTNDVVEFLGSSYVATENSHGADPRDLGPLVEAGAMDSADVNTGASWGVKSLYKFTVSEEVTVIGLGVQVGSAAIIPGNFVGIAANFDSSGTIPWLGKSGEGVAHDSQWHNLTLDVPVVLEPSTTYALVDPTGLLASIAQKHRTGIIATFLDVIWDGATFATQHSGSGFYPMFRLLVEGDPPWHVWAEKGDEGGEGNTGNTGASAYQIAVTNGFVGNVTAWLTSLQGAKGDDGDTGPQGDEGPQGDTGATGLTAYEQAVAGGFSGNVSQWLASLVGATGATGASAYQVAVTNGFVGNQAAWLTSLQGAQGIQGTQGNPGTTGATGQSAYAAAVAGGFSGNITAWLASLVGATGAAGASAYQVAVTNGFSGNQAAWLASLVGAAGTNGTNGSTGATGSAGPAGIVPRGTWSSGTSYVAHDAVRLGGIIYLATGTPTLGVSPDTDLSNWTLFIQDGITGGSIIIADNGDGTATITTSGVTITDNGDGTITLAA